jgi:hypothetical protein
MRWESYREGTIATLRCAILGAFEFWTQCTTGVLGPEEILLHPGVRGRYARSENPVCAGEGENRRREQLLTAAPLVLLARAARTSLVPSDFPR